MTHLRNSKKSERHVTVYRKNPVSPADPFCTCLGYQVPPDLATVPPSLCDARFSFAELATSVRMFGMSVAP